MNQERLIGFCVGSSIAAILAGGIGMVLSFVYLASANVADISSGMSGFVAGSILIAAGLISLTLVAIRPRG